MNIKIAKLNVLLSVNQPCLRSDQRKKLGANQQMHVPWEV